MRFFAIFFLLFLNSSWALADEVKPPADELQVTQEEVSRWQEQAKAGEGAAQYWLGKAYLYGWHLDSAPDKAIELFQQSAQAKNPQGMNALGYCLQRGIGTEQDFKAAMEWLEKATEAGSAEAANNLGNSFCLGWGVETDEPKALELYRRAAAGGSAKGMYNVAKCYYLGLGVAKDQEQALRWLEQAAAKDDVDALILLGWELSFGDRGGERLEEGRQYYTRAAEMGSSEAMVSLGKLAAREEKRRVAADWFRKAAKAGDPDGQFFYGGALLYGEGVKQDREAALEWLERAASQGHLNAKETLEAETRNTD